MVSDKEMNDTEFEEIPKLMERQSYGNLANDEEMKKSEVNELCKDTTMLENFKNDRSRLYLKSTGKKARWSKTHETSDNQFKTASYKPAVPVDFKQTELSLQSESFPPNNNLECRERGNVHKAQSFGIFNIPRRECGTVDILTKEAEHRGLLK